MVWMSYFINFFLPHEEVSKSAGEWVFCGMNHKCLEMAIQESSKKLYFYETC